jgi:LuxR family maltose regulon positive regulatory protein
VLDYLDDQLQLHEARGLHECAIELLTLKALALDAEGWTDRALGALEQGLKLAAPEGYLYVFVDKGAPMARLLYKVARHSLPEYVGRLLAAFEPETQASVTPARADLPSALLFVEPLTAREIEVLGLVAHGLSNREISQKLFISPSTVKRHTGKIYGKLGVHSRTQAVAKARLLGILSD